MTRATRYPPEVAERATRMVFEHQAEHPSQWAAICSIAAKFGMTPETLRRWVATTLSTPDENLTVNAGERCQVFRRRRHPTARSPSGGSSLVGR